MLLMPILILGIENIFNLIGENVLLLFQLTFYP